MVLYVFVVFNLFLERIVLWFLVWVSWWFREYGYRGSVIFYCFGSESGLLYCGVFVIVKIYLFIGLVEFLKYVCEVL